MNLRNVSTKYEWYPIQNTSAHCWLRAQSLARWAEQVASNTDTKENIQIEESYCTFLNAATLMADFSNII